jgi:hypothetical protein
MGPAILIHTSLPLLFPKSTANITFTTKVLHPGATSRPKIRN